MQELSKLTNYWERNALDKWMQIWQAKNVQYSDDIVQKNAVTLNNFIQQTTSIKQEIKNYETLTGIDFQQNENWIGETQNQLQNIQTHLPHLKNWMNYVQLRKQGETLQLQWFTNAYETKFAALKT